MSGTITFPPNPTIGQLFTVGTTTWQWNGTQWVNATAGQNFLPLAGGTLSGPLVLAGNGTAPLNPAAMQQLPLENYVENSSFMINQSAYASGTALAANTYGLDRWKSGASGGTLTFPAVTTPRTVTITAGSILQVMDGNNFGSAVPYTLSWQGTATGRTGSGNGGLSGAYAASPITFTATPGTVQTIEFTGGTLFAVKVQPGSVATPWQPNLLTVELAACQRYVSHGGFNFSGVGGQGSNPAITITFPVTMRVTPTMNYQTTSSGGFTSATFSPDAAGVGFAIALLSTTAGFYFTGNWLTSANF